MNQHHSVTQVKFWKEKKNEKKILGDKKKIFGGEKISFFEKKIQKKFWKKFGKFFFRFFQYYGHIF